VLTSKRGNDVSGVLSGLKVLDLSWGIAGPMTTMLMGDHGAQVTKIEPPGGDRFDVQLGYRVWGRGKARETIDLKSKEGLNRFLALADEADVVIESFSPGTVEKLGVDYATLSARNPRLVYCSISGYGRDNSHSNRPAYDALVAARTGLLWEQRGWPEGADHHIARQEGFAPDEQIPYEWTQGPARPGPVFPASRWPSLGAFFAASLGMAAALRVREITGRGQYVETSLLRGALAAGWAVWQRAANPDAPNYATWVFNSRSPKGHFLTADRKWVHEWAPNPRFTIESVLSGPSRELNVQFDPDRWGMGPETLLIMGHFQEAMAEHVAQKDAAFWLEASRIAGMPLQVCRPVEEALNDPLMLADGCVQERVDPELGPIREVGAVYRLSRCDPNKIDDAHPARLKALPRQISQPLEGIRVLDFGMAVAGPYGTQLLSDLGAEVIKIGTLNDAYWHSTSVGATCNRGKRSIQLDLKQPRAMEIVRRIVAKSDIVQHNMRYSAAQKLGIDYESLKSVKPDLIYCHTRGHERGPRETLSGNDQTAAALAGIQYEDGAIAAGGKPMWSLTSFGDTGNGFVSAIGMIHALMHRDRTGEGQFVDTSIVYASFLNMSYTFAFPDGTGPKRVRLDKDQLGLTALYRLYETAEGWLCLAITTQAEWAGLCQALEAATLRDDPRFATAEARAENDEALAAQLTPIFKSRAAAEWMTRLDLAGAPAEISDPEFSLKMFDDPEFKANKWVVGFPHPLLGYAEQAGLFFDLSETPGVVQGPPLISGADTRHILHEYGYSDAEIESLIADKIVRAAADLTTPPPKTGGIR
jgi:crotonobetainyl-CoA:carnitine CoA-transferase CaiB-like acyl-CoA transferase